jgi:hypothetical protein
MRRALATALGACVVAALAWGAWKNLGQSFHAMHAQYGAYKGYSRLERDQAFGNRIPVDMGRIGFWRENVHAGDRYWIQMPHEAFSSTGDKLYVVRNVAHTYLLPATEARSPADATVVLSWDAYPTSLHLHYSAQTEMGQQPVYAARIARGS